MNASELKPLRDLERRFEVVLYYIVFFVVFLSYVPLGVPVDHPLINFLAVGTVIMSLLAYRVLPPEKPRGRIRYTFQFKHFMLITLFVFVASAVIAATGAGSSPFSFLLAFPIIAAVILLNAIHIYLLLPYFATIFFSINFLVAREAFTYELISLAILVSASLFLSAVLVRDRKEREQEMFEHQKELSASNKALEKVIEKLASNLSNVELKAELEMIREEVRSEKHAAEKHI